MDVEAEVDEDEEDIEEDEDGLIREDGFIQEPDADEGGDNDDRLHREVDRHREALVEEDAERLASEYREKYGRSTASKYRGDSGVVPQRLLLPSVHDPNIWGVRCKPGKEKELVRGILKKKINLQYTKMPLEIYSAFQRNTFTGYIYIEARKQAAVLAALKGFTNVYPRNMVLVPIKEYPDMFRVNKTKDNELTPGTYVRIKRGKYQGDLAIVENLSENGLEARLKVVPRLDYGKSKILDSSGDGKRKRNSNTAAGRPPPRLFSSSEASQHDQGNLQRRGPNSFIYAGEEYENGYLLKDFKITYLITENVEPKLDELTRFSNANDEGIDLQAVSQSLKEAAANTAFQTGDDVEVSTGEQAGMQGKVVATQNNVVTIVGTGDILHGQQIDVPAVNLRKRFSIGDHVRVVNGNYKDDTGLVVSVEKDSVTLLSDLSQTEITVFSKDLKAASEIGGANTIGQYELHDLVQLNSQTVGCIVNIERDSVGILGQDGQSRNVPSSSITMKVTRGNQFATDRNGQEIQVGDVVKENSGEMRQGTILHIYRSTLFLYHRELQENLGVFISRISNVSTVQAKGARGVVGENQNGGGNDLNKMNPAMQRNMAPPTAVRTGGRDRIIGQRVTIGRGSQYKGLTGTIRDATDNTARIELEAKSKIVNVDKVKLLFKDPKAGTLTVPYEQHVRRGRGPPPPNMATGGPPPHRGGQTPAWGAPPGGKTPAWSAGGGGKTPAWAGGGDLAGGRTPAWNSAAGGSKTPAWSGSGGRTPAWNSGGNRTPAWNAGAKTPAWNAGAKTPTWNAGSRTPAFGGAGGDGGRTPAWEFNSRRSGPVDAPTPGGGFYGSNNAPTPGFTPGGMGAPTPGVFRDDDMSAPTPGASGYDSKTPGATTAATPGVWDTETPKYEPTSP